MNLLSRDKNVLLHPYSPFQSEPPLAIKHAQGARLYSEDGRDLIDGISSWWVILHGHCHPLIQEAISTQSKTLDQVIFAGCTHEPAIGLAEDIIQILPGEFSKVFFSDDGSTAVEVALKIAIQFWKNQGEKRTTFIALKNGYHGDTFGSMSVSSRGFFNAPFENCLFTVRYLLPPYSGEDSALAQLAREIQDDTVAAFIYEPLIQGAHGMLMYDAKVFNQYLALVKEAGIPLIADEVFTGFGRTGKCFASEYMETLPDMVCVSKGLTGGTLPLGATVINERVFNLFDSPDRAQMLLHGHSFTANPIACAAARANLSLLNTAECAQQLRFLEQSHNEFSRKLAHNPKAQRVRTLGTILAVDIGTDIHYAHPLRDAIYSFLVGQGVLLRPLGNTVYTVPPYCITESELMQTYHAIEKVIEKFGHSS